MKARIWVVCPEYTSGPFASREVAERFLERVMTAKHCRYTHEIVERVVKPVPANQPPAWDDEAE